jgi:hypothetical protein
MENGARQNSQHVPSPPSPLKSEQLFANIVNFLSTRRYSFNHSCPIRLKVTLSSLQKLQILQNRIIGKIGNVPRGIRIRDLHYSFKISTMGEIPVNVTAKKKNEIIIRTFSRSNGINGSAIQKAWWP